MKPDYKNWIPKGMVRGFNFAFLGLCAALVMAALLAAGTVRTVLLIVFGVLALGIVVLYNLGVMSYTERYREMATLKVVGFKNSKIGRLLISQNLWLTVIGILIGLPAGVGVLQYLLTALASEYEMKLTLGPATYLLSILLTFGVSLIVGLMVARKNRSIDMVAALKTEE